MDVCKVKELNEFIIDKATEKIETSLSERGWDEESFQVLSKAIVNLKYLERLEEREDKTTYIMPKQDAKKVTTEFEQLIYDIAKKHTSKEGMIAITTILAEHMEDLRVLHPKMYSMVMLRLKEMLL